MDRDRYITIRASDAEADMLTALSRATGLTKADYLRQVIRGAYDGLRPARGQDGRAGRAGMRLHGGVNNGEDE